MRNDDIASPICHDSEMPNPARNERDEGDEANDSETIQVFLSATLSHGESLSLTHR